MAIDQSSGLEKDAADLKKRIKAASAGHNLHVIFLMHQKGLSKSDALTLAYLDGPLGLNDRLNSKEPKLL